MKAVYLFDPTTFEYTYNYHAHPSPLEKGKFIVPTSSTDKAPLPTKTGFAICFINGAWEYKPDNRGMWYQPNGDQVIIDQLTTDPDPSYTRTPPLPTIAALKQSKRLQINTAFEQAMQQIVGNYPANEIASWAKQEAEARAYQVSNTATTPLIDALATARSVPKAELITRIIAKADLFASISGQLIGKRQALEDALDALPENATAQDVEAIVWA